MSRKAWYRVHKWAAVAMGLFLLGWTVSGIVMILPGGVTAVTPTTPIDYESVQLSPAQAIDRLGEALGREITATNVGVLPLYGSLVYQISMQGGPMRMIDGRTGELVDITPELAEQIVRHSLPDQSSLGEVELLEHHDLLYPMGTLPVYRVTFVTDPANTYYVNVWNGSVNRSDSMTRLRRLIVSVHTFEPVRVITHRESVQHGLLIFFSGVGIATALTGYYLALLPYLRRKGDKGAKGSV